MWLTIVLTLAPREKKKVGKQPRNPISTSRQFVLWHTQWRTNFCARCVGKPLTCYRVQWCSFPRGRFEGVLFVSSVQDTQVWSGWQNEWITFVQCNIVIADGMQALFRVSLKSPTAAVRKVIESHHRRTGRKCYWSGSFPDSSAKTLPQQPASQNTESLLSRNDIEICLSTAYKVSISHIKVTHTVNQSFLTEHNTEY